MAEATKSLGQHIQTGLQVVVVAICIWVGGTVHTTSLDVATLTERVAGMQVQVERIEANSRDRYVATAEVAALREQMRYLQQRIEKLEETRHVNASYGRL